VIAWLPRDHCHGTIAEIGYAVGIGKPTYVGFKNQKLLDDRFRETGLDEASIHGTGIMLVDSSFGKI
jgi:nucleoside 2-deoxyribosyltransferase